MKALTFTIDTTDICIALDVLSQYTRDSAAVLDCFEERFPDKQDAFDVLAESDGTMRIVPSAALLSFMQDFL